MLLRRCPRRRVLHDGLKQLGVHLSLVEPAQDEDDRLVDAGRRLGPGINVRILNFFSTKNFRKFLIKSTPGVN
jgi:hypothetical protein